ncbi:hypothetical protein DBR18_00820 [Pseudomonas sp. HMWF021]|nr:hypothetical protein DBR18_00820 [Pseudomonas sp. HMWF021]
MAIVHPAFCGIVTDSTEPNDKVAIAIIASDRTDTKHCKNRVYSPRSADVFSISTLLTMQVMPTARTIKNRPTRPNGELP